MNEIERLHAKALTSRIRAEAHRLGFLKVGVAPAGILPESDRFEAWLAQNMQGEMSYMKRQSQKRRNPGLILEGVRSILVLGMNYHSEERSAESPLKGKISRYAWGSDYHLLMKGRLDSLMSFIRQEEPEARGQCYVDTGPVMEKVWGARSSLGWIGKHSNLISRDQGSWFFIGVVLLNLDLAYDRESRGYCGTCSRCIAACPTGAIVAPYVVDARLCISYLTIELRGPIPRDLRPLIGNRIYGCDDCQEVCPWNRFAIKTNEAEFLARAGNVLPDLLPLVELSVEDFNRRFANSPIRRAKRDGFVRNVVVALGNSHAAEAVPALAQAVYDSSPLVRCHAAWALGQIPSPRARAALLEARRTEKDPDVREEIDTALVLGPAIQPRQSNQSCSADNPNFKVE